MRFGNAAAVCICLLMIFLFSGCQPVGDSTDPVPTAEPTATPTPHPEYAVHYDFNDSTSQGWAVCWSNDATAPSGFGDGTIHYEITFTAATFGAGIDINVNGITPVLDITGRDLVIKMKIPQVFITDYELRFFIKDGSNRSDKIISLSSVIADQWAILRVDSIDSSSFPLNPGADPTRISGIGIAIRRNNGPINSLFTVELDDVYVSWD
jgi:hypothetical protein